MDPTTLIGIVGCAFALGMLLLGLSEHWEKYPKRRTRVLAIAAIVLVPSMALTYLGFRKPGQQPSTSPGTSPAQSPPPAPVGPEPEPKAAPRDTPAQPVSPTTPQEPLAPAAYDDWLRKDGLVILYNAARLMEGGCTSGTMAVGDFSRGGWGTGPVVECRADGWLAFDAGQLLNDPGFFTGHTYCLNFRNAQGKWGMHGGAQRAPGMDEIGVPAAQGEQVGINIGFRITRRGDRNELQFTKEGVGHCQS